MTRRTVRAAPMAPQARRAAIIEAVIPLIIEQGGGITTRQVADAAGVAEGTIFRVFPDKRSLMLAVAEEVLNPASGRQDLDIALAGADDLREVVRRATDHLFGRMERTMTVMVGVRGYLMAQHRGESPPTGPPAFLVTANEALLATLTEVFEPHRQELRIEPATAAVLLRSLVFGCRHPGMEQERVGADDIADLLVDGICAPTTAPVGREG